LGHTLGMPYSKNRPNALVVLGIHCLHGNKLYIKPSMRTPGVFVRAGMVKWMADEAELSAFIEGFGGGGVVLVFGADMRR